MDYSLLAGERALATYANEEALSYLERGLAAKHGQPMDAEAAALLFGLGRAQPRQPPSPCTKSLITNGRHGNTCHKVEPVVTYSDKVGASPRLEAGGYRPLQ